MNENEYIDYYCQHLLWQVKLNDGTAFYDNDIRTLDYEAVLHNAKEYGITKDSFFSSVKFYAGKCKNSINLDALWKLSVLIWQWKALHSIFVTETRDIDLYIKLASLLNNGLDVESITITGKLPDKRKRTKIVFSSDEVLTTILNTLLNKSFANTIMADDNRKHHTLGTMQIALEVLGKRTIAYQIARELTAFFAHFNGESMVDEKTKGLIISILDSFSLVPPNSNNTDYNKLFSDAKNGRVPICDNYYHPTIISNIGVLDFTIVKSHGAI